MYKLKLGIKNMAVFPENEQYTFSLLSKRVVNSVRTHIGTQSAFSYPYLKKKKKKVLHILSKYISFRNVFLIRGFDICLGDEIMKSTRHNYDRPSRTLLRIFKGYSCM